MILKAIATHQESAVLSVKQPFAIAESIFLRQVQDLAKLVRSFMRC